MRVKSNLLLFYPKVLKLQISTSKILFFDVFCFRKKSDEENGYFSSFNNASEDDDKT